MNYTPLISLATKQFGTLVKDWDTIQCKELIKRKMARFKSAELLVLEQSIDFQKCCSAEARPRHVTCTPGGFTHVSQHGARALRGHVCPHDHVRIGGIHITYPLSFLFFALVSLAFWSESANLVEIVANSLSWVHLKYLQCHMCRNKH